MKKSLQKTFKDFGSEIVAESNLRIVNFTTALLNLSTKQVTLFSKLRKNLIFVLILLSTYQHQWKTSFKSLFQ